MDGEERAHVAHHAGEAQLRRVERPGRRRRAPWSIVPPSIWMVRYTSTCRARPSATARHADITGEQEPRRVEAAAAEAELADPERLRGIGERDVAHRGHAVDVGRGEAGVGERLPRGLDGELDAGDAGPAPDARDSDPGEDRALLGSVGHEGEPTPWIR